MNTVSVSDIEIASGERRSYLTAAVEECETSTTTQPKRSYRARGVMQAATQTVAEFMVKYRKRK